MRAIISFIRDDGSPGSTESGIVIEFDSVVSVPVYKASKPGDLATTIEYDIAGGAEPSKVFGHFLSYGVRQIANDACASIETGLSDTAEKAMAAANKRFDAFARGEVRSTGGGAKGMDPVLREALIMADERVRKDWKKAARKMTGKDKEIAAEAAALIKNKPWYMEQAAKVVAMRSATEDDE